MLQGCKIGCWAGFLAEFLLLPLVKSAIFHFFQTVGLKIRYRLGPTILHFGLYSWHLRTVPSDRNFEWIKILVLNFLFYPFLLPLCLLWLFSLAHKRYVKIELFLIYEEIFLYYFFIWRNFIFRLLIKRFLHKFIFFVFCTHFYFLLFWGLILEILIGWIKIRLSFHFLYFWAQAYWRYFVSFRILHTFVIFICNFLVHDICEFIFWL